MKKVMLAGVLMMLSNSIYAMDTHLDMPIERGDLSPTSMQPVETKNIGSLLVSQINVDSFRTIIRDAVTDVIGDRLPSDTEALIDTAIRVAARGVEREHVAQMRILATQVEAEINRREDAHEHELADLEAQRAETEKQKLQAEKINTLRGILLHIPITDKTPIMLRAANLIELDILERHNKVDELYKKFLPYSELFGRTDLDVIATPQDLTRVKEYITATYISPKPTLPTFIRDVHSGPKSWNKYVSFSDMTFLMKKYGMLDIAWNYAGTDWGEVHTSWAYGPEWKNIEMFNHFKDKENTERNRVYNNKLSKHNQEHRQASTQVFPSESFNRLVDQVNRFFIEGLQDTH